jgi:hypothetical protein
MSSIPGPPFICPFNSYHKLLEYRKWVYHITKCGDRRGKVVHRCPYKHDHIFIDKDTFAEHVRVCDERKKIKRESQTSKDEDVEMVAVSEQEIEAHVLSKSTHYCKYDVNHFFESEEDLLKH